MSGVSAQGKQPLLHLSLRVSIVEKKGSDYNLNPKTEPQCGLVLKVLFMLTNVTNAEIYICAQKTG